MNHENHPHYPEEYKIWEVEFFGKKFFVTPDVLIPRLETEALVRSARKILQGNSFANFSKIFDIGSGSGIIGTSIADLGEEIIFVDISANALQIAKRNFLRNFSDFTEISDKNSVQNFSKNPETETVFTRNFQKIHFIESDLLENINLENIWENEKIFIVSNLPYIKNGDWENMSEDTIFEPKLALFGGEKTGFELYEKLFSQIIAKKLHGTMIIEFGFDQRKIAEEIFVTNFPHWKVTFFADFADIERFAEIEF